MQDMDYEDFKDLVRQMRDAQKRYFNPKTRSVQVLQESKQLEAQVDEVINPQPTLQMGLFPREET